MITSTGNERVKQVRALRRRKARDEAGAFFVEGIRIVGEAIECGAPIELLVVAPDLLKSARMQESVRAQAARGVPLLEVSREVFESLSLKEGPQGIGAVVRQRWLALSDAAPDAGLCWVALDAAQDPGNIGTILRTSDAVGGAGLILLGHSADPHDPEAVRASMGALFSQRLVRASWEAFVEWARAGGVALIGTSDKAATAYRRIHYPARLCLLMGSEREGLSAAQQASCAQSARIPMKGRSDSLNLAVAAAVLLYEILHQREPDADA